jgi:hypothetical protein
MKLKCHLLPCIRAAHASDSEPDNMNPLQTAGLTDNFGTPEGRPDQVIFKNDRIYRHHSLRINYTTYDVCCTDDILNLNTEHCDIMMLHSPEDANDHQWFCYARIIGIYHANV